MLSSPSLWSPLLLILLFKVVGNVLGGNKFRGNNNGTTGVAAAGGTGVALNNDRPFFDRMGEKSYRMAVFIGSIVAFVSMVLGVMLVHFHRQQRHKLRTHLEAERVNDIVQEHTSTDQSNCQDRSGP
jgi:hypothetical protein